LRDSEVRFEISGRVDLDGTHAAVLETAQPDDSTEHDKPTSTQIIKLVSGEAFCGCILAEKRAGSANRIQVDRYKMWHLGLKDGDRVSAEEIVPPTASVMELKTSEEFSDRDRVRFIGKPLVAGEKTALFTFSGEARLFTITSTDPADGIVKVAPTTRMDLAPADPENAPITYRDIGGLTREIKLVREVVEYPFRFKEVFDHLGVTPPKGIILHGPPGTGKTLIARALANEVGARFFTISGPEVYSKWYGKSEQNLRNIFDDAVRNAPSVVVIDELDALVPRRDTTHGDQEQRIVATFLTQMDGLREMRDVVVVGTTNRINAIDPALRRGGRFEHEVLISVPGLKEREDILAIHTRRMPLEGDVDLRKISENTNGLVGADISSLCREAAYCALRRAFPEDAFEAGYLPTHAKLRVNQADFEKAARTIPPSGARELSLEVPPVAWDDIGGLDEAKRLLLENVVLATDKKDQFERAGIRPSRGILLHGPTGTGKTLLARAVANECGSNFIAVKGSDMRFKWIGESEEKIRALFSKARLLAPCVIFFDEVDSALPRRGRDPSGAGDALVNQILAEMDGVEDQPGVLVMGATNRIDTMGPAAIRPGRFDHLVEIGLPDEAAREQIFSVHLKGKPVVKGLDTSRLAASTEGFSGAGIAQVVREATLLALRESGYDAEKTVVTEFHLKEILARHGTNPSPPEKS